MNKFEKYGLKTPDILLPNEKINLHTWAVIACDQFTQDRNYWKQVSSSVNGNYSTLDMILPEIYLDDLSDNRKEEAVKKNS